MSSAKSLCLAFSPRGVLFVAPAQDHEAPLAPDITARIESAFAKGQGYGVLQLGLDEHETLLPPPFAYVRDLARAFLTTLCALPDLEETRASTPLEPSDAIIDEWVSSAPPMVGAEYITREALRAVWMDTHSALRSELLAHKGSVAEYLRGRGSVWSTVGRVCFHLAENKRDEHAPFAFMATYTTRLSSHGKVQHRPLGRALEEYAGAGNKQALLALLQPVQRAAESSELVRKFVESGDIYHPLAWSPNEALAFLREVTRIEDSGVIVRVPNWWSAKKPPRPEVVVTVGGREPSQLGQDAILDFNVSLTMDGEPLTDAERREILAASSGLRLVKGRWVEVDAEKLQQVLAHWNAAKRAASRDGLTFLEGMRLLAGAPDAHGSNTSEPASIDAWSRVQPGPWMAKVLNALRSPEGRAAADPGRALVATLRPYQRAGLAWLWTLQELGFGGCLADDMGLGKTIQVLALFLARKAKRPSDAPPHLLVVPASLISNWISEARRFAPSLRLLTAHPSAMTAQDLRMRPAKQLEGVDAVVTTYGTLHRAPWLAEQSWDIVVLDEAQAIKNPGAKQTRAVKALRARTRLALTGTPIENRLGDLWSLFDFLTPGLLGNAKDFGRITKAMGKHGDGYAPLRRLVRPYILRRLKTDPGIAPDLPDKTEVRAFCSLTKVQATHYEKAVSSLKEDLAEKDGIARRGVILAALMRFKQICNHPSQWLGDGEFAPIASGKFARLGDLAETLAARQEKALIFTQFQEMTRPIADFLAHIFGRSGLVLHGGTPVKERARLVDAFQSDAGPPFFVISLKAGGTGLNLTAATHVIHFDRWWNPAVEDQATDRAHRIGQKRSVLVHKFVCRGTVEEKIDQLVESKKSIAREILAGGGEVALTELSNDELIKLVSLDLASALDEG